MSKIFIAGMILWYNTCCTIGTYTIQARESAAITQFDNADPQAYHLMYKLIEILTKPMRLTRSISFYILQDAHFNFMNAQHFVFCTTQALLKLDNMEIVLAILAHELGHMVCQHAYHMHPAIISELTREVMCGVALLGVATILTQSTTALMAASTLPVIIAHSSAAQSRVREFNADEISVKILCDAGLDPSLAMQGQVFLHHFEQQSGSNIENIPLYLKSHPVGRERSNHLQNTIDSHQDKCKQCVTSKISKNTTELLQSYNEQYAAIHKRAQAVLLSMPIAISVIREIDKTYSGQFAYAELKLRLRDYHQALSVVNKLLTQHPTDCFLWDLKARIYETKQDIKLAIETYHITIKHAIQAKIHIVALALIRIELARVLIIDKQYHLALQTLETVKHDYDSPQVYLLISSAYIGLGDVFNGRINAARAILIAKDVAEIGIASAGLPTAKLILQLAKKNAKTKEQNEEVKILMQIVESREEN